MKNKMIRIVDSETTIKARTIKALKKAFPTAFVWKISDKWYVGIPDILFLYKSFPIFIELKSATKGKPSPKQLYTMQKIKESGGFAILAYSAEGALEGVKALIQIEGMERRKTA